MPQLLAKILPEHRKFLYRLFMGKLIPTARHYFCHHSDLDYLPSELRTSRVFNNQLYEEMTSTPAVLIAA